jgi:hypothetical protein
MRDDLHAIPAALTHPYRAPLRTQRLAPAIGAAAALPVIVATIRAVGAHWMPMGDQGIIATRAYDVLSSHPPLLGQYSEASTVSGQATYSPGPMLYWLLALPAHFGAPGSLTLTMAVVNTACVVGIVVLARRRGGLPLAVPAGVAIALTCLSWSSESLHGIFNPSAALLPFSMLVFLCWSIAVGDYRLLPLTALVASFVVQCHLGYVPPTAGLLLVALGGLLLTRRGHADPERPRSSRWLIAALAVAVLCWIAPVVDQIAHRPGNFSVLASEATAPQRTQGATRAWRAVVRAVGVPPRWLRKPEANIGRVSGVSGGDYGDTRLRDLSTVPALASRLTAVLILGALAAVAVGGWRYGRRELAGAAVIGLVLCGAFAAMVAATPTKATNTLGYMLWWGSVAGMWVWLTLAWTGVVLLKGARRPARLAGARVRALAPAAGALVVLAAGAGVAAAESADTHEPYYGPTRALASGLDRAIPSGQTVRLVQRGGIMVAIEPTIRYTLRHHGVRALGHYANRRPGAWYELDSRPLQHVVSVNGDAPARFRPATVVADVVLTDSRGRHRLTATVSPPSAKVVVHAHGRR